MIAIKLCQPRRGFSLRLDALLALKVRRTESVDRTVAALHPWPTSRRAATPRLVEYTNRFDRLAVDSVAQLELSPGELQKALDGLPGAQRAALPGQQVPAITGARSCRSWQYEEESAELSGTLLGQKVTPLARVGLYVPGGKASYPSSVLMNAIPAKVAGVKELVMVVPTPGGERNPLVLAAAAAGHRRVFCIGGCPGRRRAGLRYGEHSGGRSSARATPTSPPPTPRLRRRRYRRGRRTVGNLVICDARSERVGGDGPLLASRARRTGAGHPVVPRWRYRSVAQAIEKLLPTMPRREVIRASLENRGA